MSDADRIRLALIEETTFGETPGSPTMEIQRIASESLMQDTTTSESQEIRADRQVTEILRTNVQTSGDMNIELSFAAHEELLLAALQADDFSAAVTDVAADSGIAADDAENRLEGGDGDFSGYSVGEWVKISGFNNADNNGYAKIAAIESSDPGVTDDDRLVLTHIDLTDEAAGQSVSVTQLGSATNGTEKKSFTIEKTFTDLTDIVHVARGMTVDQFDLSIAIEQVITGTFTFMGKDMTIESGEIGNSYNSAPANGVMTSVDDVLKVLEGGNAAEGEACATQFDFSLQNNLRTRQCIGELGPESIGVGLCNITGTLQRYFESNNEMQKYLDFSKTSLAVVCEDSDGNAYIFDFPSVKYVSGQAVAGGQNSDIIAEMEWQAYRDSDEGITVRVAKLAA